MNDWVRVWAYALRSGWLAASTYLVVELEVQKSEPTSEEKWQHSRRHSRRRSGVQECGQDPALPQCQSCCCENRLWKQECEEERKAQNQ